MQAARYSIRDRIARSSWTTLYSADDKISGNKIVIKVFNLTGDINHPDYEDEAVWQSRYVLEAEIMRSIDHPHVIPLIDSGALPDGRPCLLMPYAQANLAYEIGPDIVDPAELARLSPPRRPRIMKSVRAIQVLRQVLSGLSVLHEMGIVHRDLKPANVLLSKKCNGQVRVCDFGLAKWGDRTFDTKTERIGTRRYISPEQLERPMDVDPRSDMYSLGLIGFRLLCGRLPINGERSVREVRNAVAGTNPDRIGDHMESLIYDCLDPSLAQRPLDAAAALARISGKQ